MTILYRIQTVWAQLTARPPTGPIQSLFERDTLDRAISNQRMKP